MLEDFDAATSRVAHSYAAPKGLVRVMASPTLSRLYVAPRMGEFLARYLEIAIELLISNTATSSIEDGIDVAIHSGDLSDSSLIVKKIAETSVATIATPTFLEKHGVPKHPSEHDGHRTVMFMRQGSPRERLFENKSGRIVR